MNYEAPRPGINHQIPRPIQISAGKDLSEGSAVRAKAEHRLQRLRPQDHSGSYTTWLLAARTSNRRDVHKLKERRSKATEGVMGYRNL